MRVLTSFPTPGPQTNPYIVQLAAALRSTPGVEVSHFGWRQAWLGRYDVVHLHWPEILVQRGQGPKRLARQLLVAGLLLRWRLGGVAVVRTMHNSTPHEPPTGAARPLLAALERLPSARTRSMPPM